MEADDLSSYEELVAFTLEALREQRAAGRRTVLVGESLGAVVCLGAALAEPQLVDGLALVNPATSIGESWIGPVGAIVADMLPEQLYNSLPALVTPLFGAAGWFDGITGQAAPDFPTPQALLALSSQLSELLPPRTLKHRLSVLADGSSRVGSRLASAKSAGGAAWPWARRCCLIATSADLILPSVRETERLRALIPGSTRCVVDGPGHVCLDDDRVNLLQLLTAARIFDWPALPPQPLQPQPQAAALAAEIGGASVKLDAAVPSVAATVTANAATATAEPDADLSVANGVRGRAAAAAERPQPVVRATESISALTAERLEQLEGAAALTSPVFFSRRADGSLERGVHSVPLPADCEGRPVLFVGNHQLFGIDGPLLVRELLNERGVLVKSLVFPPLMGKGFSRGPGASAEEQRMPLHPLPYPPSGTAAVFELYGAQPISARALARLLGAGEPVLVFPGGGREVFKRRGEAYRLFWPEAPDLLRIAAKYDAVVVPFSGVGSDELGEFVADTDELLALPLVGDWLRSRVDALPSLVEGDLFVPPLIVPRIERGIPRHYFLFGQPLDTKGIDRADLAAVSAAWAELRASVEDGLGLLRRRRSEDPYADFYLRTAYERLAAGRQAPSFK